MDGSKIMIWVYLLTGAICSIIGVLVERQSHKPMEESLDELLRNYGMINREFATVLEQRNRYRELYEDQIREFQEYKHNTDSEILQRINTHLKTENSNLIRKNKDLKSKNEQYKSNVKQLRNEIKQLTKNNKDNNANKLKLSRYKKEITQLHQAILSKNETIKELTIGKEE